MTYEVTQLEKGDFVDRNGNYWCTAVFQGISEPITWVMKDPTRVEIGDKVNGEIKPWTSAKGKVMQRFYKEQQQQGYTNPGKPQTTSNKPDEQYWSNKDAQIKAQWAINQSREYIQHMLGKDAKLAEVLETAKLFYGMVDQVKEVVTDTQQATTSPGEPITGQDEVHDFDANDVDIISLDSIPFN